jgi:hypothetical protein
MKDAGARTNGSYGLLALGAAIAGFYVVAQLIQQVVVRFMLPDAPDVAAEIASRLLVPNRVRQAAVLASIFLVPLAYAALASARWRYAPGPVISGLLFGLLFVALECAYRSIDLFAVGAWAAEFAATTDPMRRDAQLERFMLWDGVVISLYLPLLAAHALSSAAFAVAVASGGESGDRWDWLLAVVLGVNALRGILRMLQMHAGITALGPVNGALYLPVTLLTYGMLSAWLARAALQARRADDRSAAGA